MIQRIQTLYLLLVCIGCILLIFFPLAQYDCGVQGIYIFYAYGLKYTGDTHTLVQPLFTSPLPLLLLLTLIIIFISIFFYKKRKTQILLINIGFLLQMIFIGLIFLLYAGHFEKFLQPHLVSRISYHFGIFLPLIMLLFLILAGRAVRKDEALVKSTSHLR